MNTPVGDDRRILKEFNVRLDTGRGHDQIGLLQLAVVQAHAVHVGRPDEGHGFDPKTKFDATLDQSSLHDGGGEGIEDPRHDRGTPADDSDVNSQIGEQQRQLDADETVAHDKGRTGLAALHSTHQFVGHTQGLEIKDPGQLRALQRCVEPAARRDDQTLEGNPAVVTQHHLVVVDIDSDHHGLSALVDPSQLGHVRALPVQRLVAPREEVVGHGRGGVRRVRLGRQRDDRAGRILIAQCLGGSDTRWSGTDDHGAHQPLTTMRSPESMTPVRSFKSMRERPRMAVASGESSSKSPMEGSLTRTRSSKGSSGIDENSKAPRRSTHDRARATSPSFRHWLTTRSIVSMPSSLASRAVSKPTWTELNVGSTTMRARSNPRDKARPKCSTPAWVSMMTTSPRRRLMLAMAAASKAFSGQRQPPPARRTPPMTKRRTPSRALTAKRSTTSEVSGLRRSITPEPSPGRAPVFSSM